MPDQVLAAAKGSLTWRTIDAELAALAFDSLTDDLAGVRSEGGDRQLTFRTPGLEIEVLVRAGRSLIGQLVPPQPAVVELLSAESSFRSDVSGDGVFGFDDIPPGPLSLRCALADGDTTVTTQWLVM